MLGAGSVALLALAQSPLLPGDEGDLGNRSFLPKVSAAAEAQLAAFQQNLSRGRSSEASTALARLLENSDPQGELLFLAERLGVGLRERLEIAGSALPPSERACYAQACGEIAAQFARGGGRDENALDKIARSFPGSPAAADALLRLGDFAFERGDSIAAASLYRRSHSARGAERLRLLTQREIQKPARLAPQESWSAEIQTDKEDSTPSRPVIPLAAQSSLFTQTGKYLYEHDARGKRLLAFPLDAEIFDRDLVIGSSERNDGESQALPPLRPQWLGARESPWEDDALFLMHGDGEPPLFSRRLVALRLGDDAGTRRASVAWQRGWGLEDSGDLADLALGEGFLVRGGRVFLQAHRMRGEASSYALCLDAKTGRLLWMRFLCKGVPIANSENDPALRLKATEPQPPSPLSPLLFPGVVVFANNLGVVAGLDPADGSYLWALRTARNKEGQFRWETPALLAQDASANFAPADSGWLYRIRPTLPESGAWNSASLFASNPWLGKPLKRFLGEGEGRLLFLESAEDRLRLIGIEPSSRREIASAWIPRGEGPIGFDSLDARLLLVQSNALQIFDAGAELRLVAQIRRDPPPEGSMANSFRGGCLLPSGVAVVVSNKLFFEPAGSRK